VTNTLHRKGTPSSLKNDYVIFCTMAKGINSQGSGPKIQEFIRICLKYNPVNMGDGYLGNILQEDVGIQRFLSERSDGEGAAAVFADLDTLQKVIDELIRADLGVSINISGLLDEVQACCRKAGMERHSVEHSLGVWGAKVRLPEREILEDPMRPWDGLLQPHPQDGGVRQAAKIDPPKGGEPHGQVLRVRGLQPGPRRAASGKDGKKGVGATRRVAPI
jgi:hypothetical protein